MTIGSYLAVIVILLLILLLTGAIALLVSEITGSSVATSVSVIIGCIIAVVICGVYCWWRINSASGQRALKDQKSELNGGIERIVSVYDINGEIIQQYSGKFDIETDRTSYILFDDEQGKRHIIYYTTGTIIVDEK